MPGLDQDRLSNRLLRLLPPEEFDRLAARLEPVELAKNDLLFEPDRPIAHAVFPERGIVSIIASSPEGLSIESGLFGRDGLSPPGIAMGVDRSPHRCIMQVAGDGHRLPLDALTDLIAEGPGLRGLALRFAYALSVQTAFTALSNAVHPVDERLARWLLMCHDRVSGDELHLTHDFLSVMLAVRRPSVTTSLHVLEGNRFVRAGRGVVTIRDRAALEEFAGDAYGRPEAEYERLVGPLR